MLEISRRWNLFLCTVLIILKGHTSPQRIHSRITSILRGGSGSAPASRATHAFIQLRDFDGSMFYDIFTRISVVCFLQSANNARRSVHARAEKSGWDSGRILPRHLPPFLWHARKGTAALFAVLSRALRRGHCIWRFVRPLHVNIWIGCHSSIILYLQRDPDLQRRVIFGWICSVQSHIGIDFNYGSIRSDSSRNIRH